MKATFSGGLVDIMSLSGLRIEDLVHVENHAKHLDIYAVNDDVISLKKGAVNIQAYANFMNIKEIDCAKMAWEFSNNKISSPDSRRYSKVVEAVADCYSSLVSAVANSQLLLNLPWIAVATIEFHRGDFEELPEEIINVKAEEILQNNELAWWFSYDFTILKKRECAYLPELDISTDEWGKSHTPVRLMLSSL